MLRKRDRVRAGGCREFYPQTGEERLAAFRAVVESKSYAKIDSTMVDTFSASAVLAVHAKLSEANRGKFVSMSAAHMCGIAFRLVQKFG